MKPEISIIIPVYDEAGRIGNTLAQLAAAVNLERCEIIISDGAPDGSTIRELGRPGITCLRSAPGRGIQMNTGAAAARAPILLFVHADTALPPGADGKIIRACRDRKIAGGAFDLGIDNTRLIYRWIEAVVRLRTRITRIPYGDQAIFMKRRIFEKLGGFARIPIMEDIELMRRVRRTGRSIALISDPVLTDARRWEAEGPLFCTARNTLLSFLYYCGVSPGRLKHWYP